MKKANKILMAAVAILLSLVLISTSVLSGVFAKFVITDKADISVGFTKWGVTVNLVADEAGQLATVNANHGNQAAFTATLDSSGNNATYEIKNLKLAPGDNLDKIAHFTISGSAEVPLRVYIIFHINFTADDFTIPTNVSEVSYPNIANAKGCCLFPIHFGTYLKNPTNNTYDFVDISNPFRSSVTTGNVAEGTCKNIFDDKLDVTQSTINGDGCVYKDFSTPGTKISFNHKTTKKTMEGLDFYLGFDYLIETSRSSGPNLSEAAVNAVSTYLSQNKPNATFDVRFTVSVEQIVT